MESGASLALGISGSGRGCDGAGLLALLLGNPRVQGPQRFHSAWPGIHPRQDDIREDLPCTREGRETRYSSPLELPGSQPGGHIRGKAGFWSGLVSGPLEVRGLLFPQLTSSAKNRTATPWLGQVGVLEHDSTPAAHKDAGPVRPTLGDVSATH